MTLEEFNRLERKVAQAELQKCCGASEWVKQMTVKRPYSSLEEIKNTSSNIWSTLDIDDYKEAFLHHPKIGRVDELRKKFASTEHWASQEQAGVKDTSEEVLLQLAQGNEEYEKKFGYIFIVCATGKSAEDMLALLTSRLLHSVEVEIQIAQQEQNKITQLRLEKLIS